MLRPTRRSDRALERGRGSSAGVCRRSQRVTADDRPRARGRRGWRLGRARGGRWPDLRSRAELAARLLAPGRRFSPDQRGRGVAHGALRAARVREGALAAGTLRYAVAVGRYGARDWQAARRRYG